MDRPDRVKDRISERLRIAGSLLFILLFFILTAVLVKVPMDPGVFFSVTMATIWFINSFGAVVQGSLFGLVGLLPQKYSTVFMSGQGLAGTFAALAMLLALSSGTDSETAALGYFITPCVGTLVSVASYLLLPQLKGVDPPLPPLVKCLNPIQRCVDPVCPVLTAPSLPLVFAERYFTPVCCFLAFNVMDWAGRTVTSFVRWPRKESPLFPVLVCCRVVFIPLLMLCNVQERSYLPVLFSHDSIFALLMLLFSLSSGYCVCLSMSYAPQLVKPQDAETAGALMAFFLALGLSLGAALSFPLRALV
ncbi:UNVERIFIED_CONTAM: hypothetical protein FKN15_026253 [Acipenser sinensis]